MATGKVTDYFLSRREALGLIGAVGVTALMGCGNDSGSAALTNTPTQTPTGTATARPSATSTATGSPTATATPVSSATPTPAALSCVVSPALTEGPYFVDELLNRSDLTADTTRPAVLNGVPLLLKLGAYSVSGNSCTPLAGVQVDVWHADANGVYSDESAQNTVGERFLRGYQISDQNGAVQFTTIFPGWYMGRTAHIHFKVRTYSATGARTFEFTSQLFFDDAVIDVVYANAPYNSRGPRDTTNARDSIFNAQTLVDIQPADGGRGYVATFTIGLQT